MSDYDLAYTYRSGFTTPRSIDPVEYAIKGRFDSPTPEQISKVIKQVQRNKQKLRDEERWEEHCEQNVLVSITGSYVVKEKSYPKIVLPCNESHSSLFKSGAITIISNDSLQEQISSTGTNVTGSSFLRVEEVDVDDENYVESSSEEKDIILQLNQVNIGKNDPADDYPADDSDQNKTDKENTDTDDNEINYLDTTLNVYKNVHVEKLRSLRFKIDASLDNIKVSWEINAEPDGEEDLARRKKRANEFSSRFSRQYLYNLGRQMTELRKLLKNRSPRFGETTQLKEHQILCQKFANAHSILLLGLNAYHKHMPSSIPGGVPEKLRDLMTHACELWRMCNKYELLKSVLYTPGRTEIFIDDIDTKCKIILQQIREDKESNKWSEAKSLTNLQSPSNKPVKRSPKAMKGKERKPKVHKLSDRLSMYTLETPKHTQIWRKLSKTKSIVKQRINKKIIRPTGDESEIKIEEKLSPSKEKLKKKKSEMIVVPVKEDEIVTQMDIMNERESGEAGTTKIVDMLKGKDGAGEQDVLVATKPGIKPQMLKAEYNETLRPLLLEILHNIDCKENLDGEKSSIAELKHILTEIKEVTQNDDDSNEKTSNKVEKQNGSAGIKKGFKTIVGPKNAKLICLSPVESVSEEKLPNITSPKLTQKVSPKSSPKKHVIPKKNFVKKGILKHKKAHVKRVHSIPEQLLENCLKYKEDYEDYASHNSMYVQKKNRKPWEIVSRISDGILDGLLQDIMKELEIDNVLVNLCEMELT